MKIDDFNLRIEKGGVFLGDEELDIETKFYSKYINLFKQKCTLEIEPPEKEDEINIYLDLVENCISWLDENEDSVKSHISENLLNLRNTTWIGNKKTIDNLEFINELKIVILSIDNIGAMNLYFDDGKMFEGHCITLSISKSRKMKKAKIEG